MSIVVMARSSSRRRCLFIPLIDALAMLPGGLVAGFTTRWWRWLVVGAGSAFLFLPAVGVASEEIGNVDGLSAFRWFLLLITSTLVFATIPLVAIVIVRTVDRLSGRRLQQTAVLQTT